MAVGERVEDLVEVGDRVAVDGVAESVMVGVEVIECVGVMLLVMVVRVGENVVVFEGVSL